MPNELTVFSLFENGWAKVIKKYGSTFYAGIAQVKNGRLYLRYMGAALRKPQQIEPTLLQTKSLCYTIVKNAPRVLLPHSEAEKRKLENFDFVILLSSFFFVLLLLLHHA